MARLIGPSEASREVKSIGSNGYFKSKALRPATFYVDPDPTATPSAEMLTTLADVRSLAGAPYAGSTVTTDAYSMLPLMQFPDGVDSLLVSADGGPPWRVYAREDDRIDALAATVAAGRGFLPAVNVRDFLADPATAGDGITDHTSAIAAAVASLPNGGIVNYGVGTWIASGVPLATRVIHRGAGRAATTVKLKSGTNNSLFKTTNFDTLTGTDTTTTPWGFGIQDLTVDGNKAGQTTGTSHGVAIYGCGYHLDRIHIVNCRSKGLWTEWATTTPSAVNQVGGSMEAFVTDYLIRECDDGAISHQGPHDTQFLNGILVRNCSDQVNGIVVDMPADGRANGSTFTGFHIWGALNAYGVRCNSSGIAFVGCQIEGSMVAQVRFGASLNQWLGGKLFAGYVPAQASKAIVLDAGVNNLDIDTKVENLSGGVIDVSAGSIGNNRVRVLASYYSGATTPTNALIGTVDNNSEYDISVITSAGVLDPTTSIWRRGLVQFKPTYMSIGPTANSTIMFFLKAQSDSQKGILLAQCSPTQTGDLLALQTDGFADLWRFDKWGRPIAAGTDVSLAPGAAAVSAVAGSRGVKDCAGHLVATALASPVAGALATVTFAHTWSATPKAPQLTAYSAAAATAGIYVSAVTTSSFTISCANAPAASAVLDIGWTIVG